MEITDEAVELLRKSLDLAGIDPSSGGVRLRGSRALGGGYDIQVELADERLDDEELVEVSGLRLFVDPEVARAMPKPVVTVDPQHDTIVIRPAEPSGPAT
jgi:Fe-S cluster assembly iron-binding protein IscA